MRLTLLEIQEAIKAKLINPTPLKKATMPKDIFFDNISTDTRTLQTDDLFIALKGENFDGNRFAKTALEGGASGLILERGTYRDADLESFGIPVLLVENGVRALGDLAQYWRNRFQIPVVAITGSNGKTTTRAMTGTLLAQNMRVHQSQGNFNNWIGLPLTLLKLARHHEVMILEMGMNQLGEIARMTEIAQPTLALITNVGPVHLEHLKNIETVAMAKGELFKNVSPDACVVINQDDSFCSLLADRAGIDRKNRLTFGWKNSADIQVEKIKSTGLKGSEVWIRDHRNGSSIPLHLHLPLPGTHNIYNLLAAVSCALYLGVSKEEIIQGVNMIEPVGSRTRTCWLKGDRHIIDDCYNANPASMNASLGLLKSLKGDGKAIAVLGEMLELGPESDRAHYQLGQLAAQCEVQELFVVGEHAAQVAKGAKEGGIDEGQIHLIYEGQRGKPPDELMEVLSSRIREVAPVDCWILVKGSRGVALERVVAHLEGYFPREKENR